MLYIYRVYKIVCEFTNLHTWNQAILLKSWVKNVVTQSFLLINKLYSLWVKTQMYCVYKKTQVKPVSHKAETVAMNDEWRSQISNVSKCSFTALSSGLTRETLVFLLYPKDLHNQFPFKIVSYHMQNN